MRETLVLGLVAFVTVYAQINWFRALCILVVFTAVQDYPGATSPIQIKGFNDWVIMALSVLVGWGRDRISIPRPFLIPRPVLIIMGLYFTVELLATVRLCGSLEEFRERAGIFNEDAAEYTVRGILVDIVYVPVRYMVLGFLLLDGVRNRRDLTLGLASVLAAATIYALVINKQIPIGLLAEQDVDMRRVFQKWTQRYPNDLARDLGAALWSMLALTIFGPKLLRGLRTPSPHSTGLQAYGVEALRAIRAAAWVAAPLLLLALAHSHSRGGYLGFAAAGFAVAVLTRWWRALGFMALVGVGVAIFAPNITGRALAGINLDADQYDVQEIAAGRQIMWPAALKAVGDSPLVGYGLFGYVLSEALDGSLAEGGGELHPHNAYLQTMLDHGLLFGPMRLAPYVLVLVYSLMVVRRAKDPLLAWAGVFGLSWTVTTLAMGFSGQHYGLTQNMWMFWCVAGLVIRSRVLYARSTLVQPPVTATQAASVNIRRPSLAGAGAR